VSCRKNTQVDSLAKLASAQGASETKIVIIGYQPKPSIKEETTKKGKEIVIYPGLKLLNNPQIGMS